MELQYQLLYEFGQKAQPLWDAVTVHESQPTRAPDTPLSPPIHATLEVFSQNGSAISGVSPSATELIGFLRNLPVAWSYDGRTPVAELLVRAGLARDNAALLATSAKDCSAMGVLAELSALVQGQLRRDPPSRLLRAPGPIALNAPVVLALCEATHVENLQDIHQRVDTLNVRHGLSRVRMDVSLTLLNIVKMAQFLTHSIPELVEFFIALDTPCAVSRLSSAADGPLRDSLLDPQPSQDATRINELYHALIEERLPEKTVQLDLARTSQLLRSVNVVVETETRVQELRDRIESNATLLAQIHERVVEQTELLRSTFFRRRSPEGEV